jgi:AraC family transcriptional regulator
VLQPDPAQDDLFHPCAPLLERVGRVRDPAIAALAWRMAAEARSPDALTSLALEGLALELVSTAARLRDPGGGRAAPPWLTRAEEILRERFAAPLRLAEVAREVGVHPAHLARAFRGRHRMPIGAFVRRLRLDWAAQRLAATRVPLARIALQAGFADQSHFTRAFKRRTGLTPGRYRRTLGSSPGHYGRTTGD